jgi:hypothetical protein
VLYQCAGTLAPAIHMQALQCRNIIHAGLGAVLDKARRELGVCNGAGVVGVSRSLHAVAAVLTRLQPE